MERVVIKLDEKVAAAAAERIQAEAQKQVSEFLRDVEVFTLARAFREGYVQAMLDHDLEARPAGVTKTVEVETEEVQKRFTLVGDNDGHSYVIPAEKRSDWFLWLEQVSGIMPEWDLPDYAKVVSTPLLTFADPVES